jgi:glucose dehydrogenase
MNPAAKYDVVIVGAGVAGAMISKRLGAAGKKVLILEAGAPLPDTNNDFMQRFYLAQAKVPEAPYTPALWTNDETFGAQTLVDPGTVPAGRPTVLTLGMPNWQDPTQAYLDQQGPLAFSSTYERVAGGTMRHWLGTSLRNVPHDFDAQSTYEAPLVDWPIGYDDLEKYYRQAESEIGISANVVDQEYLGITFPNGYQYPMRPIPNSLVDNAVSAAAGNVTPVDGIALSVSNTPAGRNSETGPEHQDRRVCAGNTNCIPICPIQAKYDPSVTLEDALQTGNVDIWAYCVATKVLVGDDGKISGIEYQHYDPNGGSLPKRQTITAELYVVAAHAIETPRLLLMSANQNGKVPHGVANSSGLLGKNLMDHPLYLAWALAPNPVYPYRGPLATAGIESLRDGAFRKNRAAFRIEIGNEGWNFAVGDPTTTAVDFITGANRSGLNTGGPGKTPEQLSGSALVTKLNTVFTRQFRLGFLLEETPDLDSTVTLSETWTDGLGLPRPRITYDFSPYTKLGFVAARHTASAVFAAMGATEFTVTDLKGKFDAGDPTVFKVSYTGDPLGRDPLKPLTYVPDAQVATTAGVVTEYIKFFGAGHVGGTYRMGTDKTNSVVDRNQRSWDHENLYLVGNGVFPTIATANPTLTLAALALWAGDSILAQLGAAVPA